MKYLNHVTLNTGHCKKQYREDIDIDLKKLAKSIEPAFSDKGMPFADDTILKIIAGKNEYVATIYVKV